MAAKTFTAVVSDPSGVTVLGIWPDAPIPSVRLGAGGVPAWQLTLPRQYGALDEPGEPGSGGTLAWGNRIDIIASSDESQAQPLSLAFVGSARVGQATVGQSNGLGVLVWRGSIESWDPTPPDAVAVSVSDLARILDGAPIVGTQSFSGDPCAIAQSIVQQYLPGLSWDVSNPAAAGTSVTVTLTNLPVRAALEQLRDLCGLNWLLVVTPRGTVRLWQPDTSVATHTLRVGIEVTSATLHKSGIGRRKRIIVAYAGGLTAEARAPDYNPNDPRAEIISASSLTQAGDAQRLAGLALAARDRIQLRGECLVDAARYDVDSIQVGDTVRLQAEAAVGSAVLSLVGSARVGQATIGFGGYQDYAGQNLVVAGIDYALYTVRLELSQPQPRQEDAIVRLNQQVAAHLAKG